MNLTIKPIAFVRNARKEPIDDNWAEIISEIELEEYIPAAAFSGISDFSHLEIIFWFDKVKQEDIIYAARPRGNPAYPVVGIFAQRKKDRPNSTGLCTVELIAHKERTIVVKNLDAIDGTPVIDIKPVFREFQPKSEIKQPVWVEDLMRDYW